MKKSNLWRVLTLALALVMLFAVVACTNEGDATATTEGAADAATTPAATTTAKKTTAKATTAATTAGTTVAADPKVYSGVPDTSWYDSTKTEFTLTTADQVIGFFDLRNQNTSFKGMTVKMATDVVYNPGNSPEEVKAGIYNWWAINSNNLFEGTFDGQNHTFSGFKFVAAGSCTRGMFGSMGEGAVIKNLKMVNSYFCGPEIAKETFGLLVSRVRGMNNTIINVTSENALYEYGEGTMGVVGGLVGKVESNASITIENCTVAGTMNMNAKTCGGFIGDIASASASVTIKNCVNKINITAVDKVGGIAGHMVDGATLTVEGFTNEGTLVTTGEGSIAKDDKVPANPAA